MARRRRKPTKKQSQIGAGLLTVFCVAIGVIVAYTSGGGGEGQFAELAPSSKYCQRHPSSSRCTPVTTTVVVTTTADTTIPATTTTPPPTVAPPVTGICSRAELAACPASYFTGPLGANNLIPARAGQFLADQAGGNPCDWNTCVIPLIQKRQADIGRHFDVIAAQKWFGLPADGCTARDSRQDGLEQWVHQNGSYLVLRWNPAVTIGQVNTGAYDTCFKNLATYLNNLGFGPIMFSPFTEFDDRAGVWQAVPSVFHTEDFCGAPFINAWRRMVNIMHPLAPRLGFVWEPGEGMNRACATASYPGDAYVDWVGSDWYNFCFVSEGGSCWSTPLHGGWANFWEVWDYSNPLEPAQASCCTSKHDEFGWRKPFFIMETGTVYDTSYPAKKAQWYGGVVAASKKMKYLRGIIWFDADVSQVEAARNNFRVDSPTSDPSVNAAFVQMAKDPWFAAGQ